MYTLEYDPDMVDRETDSWSFIPSFLIRAGRELVGNVHGVMSSVARLEALARLGLGRDEGDDEPLRQAFTRYVLNRAETELADDQLRPALLGENTRWHITTDNGLLEDVLAETGPKACSYQRADGRDLFCLCPSDNDRTVRGTIDGRPAAPTSRPICEACNLPSTTWICSHFLHPGVGAVLAIGLHERMVDDGLCDEGHADRINAQPDRCRPGGHDCWRRVVEPGLLDMSISPSPLSLPEAFDFLDAVWRIGHGNAHLLGHVAMTHSAGLAQPCTSRDEFRSRLSDLTDVLDGLRVPAFTAPPGVTLPPNASTLLRLKTYLGIELAADPAAVDRVEQAVDSLLQIARVRAALQHSDAARRLPGALASLGIPYPPEWDRVWDVIRDRAIVALVTLRDEVRRRWP